MSANFTKMCFPQIPQNLQESKFMLRCRNTLYTYSLPSIKLINPFGEKANYVSDCYT